MRLSAVLTSDLVHSSEVPAADFGRVLGGLREIFRDSSDVTASLSHYQIHRGDAFQVVATDISRALHLALFLRFSCISQLSLDVRTAVGVDTVARTGARSPGEGSGPAFTRSGRLLGEMGRERICIRTPDEEINAELTATCALLDALVDQWSAKEAEAAALRLRGGTQRQIATMLGISQPALSQRLNRAGWWAVEAALARWEQLAQQLASDKLSGE